MAHSNIDPVTTSSPTINPYRQSAALAWHRFIWDMDYRAWASRKRLKKWKDRYRGDKCIILCNGPSLLKVDFETLAEKKIFTFGLNKIDLLFQKTSFRPSCIVAVNKLVIEQNAGFYNQTELPLFLSNTRTNLINFRENITFFHYSPIRKFARDCTISVAGGSTVTFVALQLAFHMGFRKVALVGCDHNFATKGPENMTVASGAEDKNHFDPNYFAGGVKWQLPDLAGSEFSYSQAARTFNAFGGEVVNCTEGGQLEIFKRQELRHFL